MVIFLVLQRVPTGWQGAAGDPIVAPKKEVISFVSLRQNIKTSSNYEVRCSFGCNVSKATSLFVSRCRCQWHVQSQSFVYCYFAWDSAKATIFFPYARGRYWRRIHLFQLRVMIRFRQKISDIIQWWVLLFGEDRPVWSRVLYTVHAEASQRKLCSCRISAVVVCCYFAWHVIRC